MRRTRRSRAARDAFGASLLDMMCCGLGASIVVFVLRQMEINRDVESAEGKAEAMRKDAIFQEAAAEEAKGEAKRLAGEAIIAREGAEREERKADRIGAEIRARQRATVFGLPAIKGNLSVLVDRSGSMDGGGKIEIAFGCIENVVVENPLIDRLRVASFSQGNGESAYRVHFDRSPGPPGSDARKGEVDRLIGEIRSSIVTGGGTDLVGAIARDLAWLEQVGGGTILLVTDGIAASDIESTRSSIREFRRRHPGMPLVIHTIGLLQESDGLGVWSRDASDQPGYFISLLANDTGGTLVGIPVPLRIRR